MINDKLEVERMGFFDSRNKSAINSLFIIVFLFSCSQQPQYKYEVPEKTDDGWETVSLSEAGVDPAKINDLMLNILNEKYKNVHSVLLVKNGKLIFEEYFQGYHRNRIHPIQSDTKSITSILIGIAIDQRIISNLDKKVYEFFPNYKGTKWVDQKYEINIKHALTMTAGLDWDERTYPHGDSRNNNTAMNNSIDWIEFIMNKEMARTPGERFNYTSGLSILLGGIIKNASGLYADDFAEKYLFKPLGITDYKWYRNYDNTIHTGGGLQLKPRDMAKIGYLMLKGGIWQGKQIVSHNWVNESTQAHIEAGGYEYGYQWWRGKTINNNRIIEAFWAWGHGGQFILILPSLDLVVVFTAKHRDNPGFSKRAFDMLSNYIIPAVLPPSPPRETIKVDKRVIDRCVGTYKFIQAKEPDTVIIFREGDRLFGRGADDEDKAELFPETENRFSGTAKDIGDFRINFVMDDKGEVNHFVLHFARQFVFLSVPFVKIK
jgi:CubicO group peptidase (beta-lactamase class C family)